MSDAADMLRTYLAERDELCPGCAYNLRALTGTRCPECNQELVLRVGLAEPRMAWFVAGVIGIAMGLGFSLMVLVWTGAMVLSRGRVGGPRFQDMVPLRVGTLVGAAAMYWWVHARRRLAGASNEKRWLCVVAATTVALASPMWFFAIVR
jgi:hypothetical protein